MNCSEIQELLSAYFDDELSEALQTEVSQHLDDCPKCAQSLTQFEKLSLMARELDEPRTPPSSWPAIAQQLDQPEQLDREQSQAPASASAHAQPSVQPAPSPTRHNPRRLPLGRITLAATILLAAGIGWWLASGARHLHDEEVFASHFAEYVQEFRSDPANAQEQFLARFENHLVAPDEAVTLVGYTPAVTRGVPEGYRLVSTHVVTMPCCTCVQSLCRRSDGTMLAIFEHADQNASHDFPNADFGDHPCVSAKCRGRDCCLMDIDDQLAATWKDGPRHITLVGINDLEEVDTFVGWWDDRSPAHEPQHQNAAEQGAKS